TLRNELVELVLEAVVCFLGQPGHDGPGHGNSFTADMSVRGTGIGATGCGCTARTARRSRGAFPHALGGTTNK
ncbi:MAG TPA: hypothetical protein VIJ00_02740, partial [Nakamurella sp.]